MTKGIFIAVLLYSLTRQGGGGGGGIPLFDLKGYVLLNRVKVSLSWVPNRVYKLFSLDKLNRVSF